MDNITDVDTLLSLNTDWIFIYFYASWCKPCDKINSFISQLIDNWQHVSFCKIDIDVLSDFSYHCGVNVLPTFILFKKLNIQSTEFVSPSPSDSYKLKYFGKFIGTNPEKIINLLKLSNT